MFDKTKASRFLNISDDRKTCTQFEQGDIPATEGLTNYAVQKYNNVIIDIPRDADNMSKITFKCINPGYANNVWLGWTHPTIDISDPDAIENLMAYGL